MDTNKLKKFAQEARVQLIAQVGAKMGLVLAEGSAARREASPAVEMLEREIRASSTQQVIEKVAYTWFNRFTALRFMDANGYTNPRVVTPAEGQTLPEILADAKSATFDEAIREPIRKAVTALLDGRTPSRDGQGEAYRLLLVAICNHWHVHMPFMFEKIADYTELLMPEDLLSSDSILSQMRAAMTDNDCRDVEIIGWLYQFYISEKKDQVFAALKKNVKISAENIPAATQLFTPHWIVRYLLENSLGRLWLLNRPQSKLAAQMDYYIASEEPETDFLRITKPEEIRICDPACGSGHMLTYAFDLLHAIYEEEGYDVAQIPALILTHNLHGIEIDDRAGALAAFALAMKAAASLGRRRFLRMEAQPYICVLQNVSFTPAEMQDVATVVGRDLFTEDLRATLGQFEQAKNFGSLIVPKLYDPTEVARVVHLKEFRGDFLLREVQERVLKVLNMAKVLAPVYHVVVANPPYAGMKGLNKELGTFAKQEYELSKPDLFSMFMERGGSLLRSKALLSMINMQAWMFISSFEGLRRKMFDEFEMLSMVHLGERAFDTIGGAVVSTTAFVMQKNGGPNLGDYVRLCGYQSESEKKEAMISAVGNPQSRDRFRIRTDRFKDIPGQPLAYWVSENVFQNFRMIEGLGNKVLFRQGMSTTDATRFERNWSEVAWDRFDRKRTKPFVDQDGAAHWFPFHKGGDFRKWYGNQISVVKYERNGEDLIELVRSKYPNISDPEFVIKNRGYFFRSFISYASLGTSSFSAKSVPAGFAFSVAGPAIFSETFSPEELLCLLCSSAVNRFMGAINPTLGFQIADVQRIPFDERVSISLSASAQKIAGSSIGISKSDWDAYETSWDFTKLPLLAPEHCAETLKGSFDLLRAHWQSITNEMQRLEEENNRLFIHAYGLKDELTPEVPLEEITLTCNPAYRYGGKATDAELEARLLSDTMAEFLHYAVGCMFGRYSLDTPGLILVNQGEGAADYLARVPAPSFEVDADNVIPVVEGDWFADDIVARFRKFLRVTFGEPNFQENLSFIEAALGKDIGKWFTRDFFDYHVRRFKKRPIYWMFSSPKGTFNVLIYMHRYRPDTVSVVLNDYLREFISRLQAERARLDKLADDPAASQAQRTKALKDIAVLIKQIDELTHWERDVVFPLAQAKIEIDLDDGVKANYPKFGAALKAIKGLDGKEDE